MIARDTLRYGLYVAIGTLLLTLTGMFGTFAGRIVIDTGLTLSTVLLVLILAGTGFLAAQHLNRPSAGAALLNGMAGSLVVGVALALLVVLQTNVSLSFVFPDVNQLLGSTVTLGQTDLGSGLLSLLGASAGLGLIGGALPLLPREARGILLLGLGMTVVIGLLQSQIRNIFTLPDALAVALTIVAGYLVAFLSRRPSSVLRAVIGALAGLVVAVLLAVAANSGGLEPGGILRGTGAMPVLLNQDPANRLVAYGLIFAVIGALGGVITVASRAIHNGVLYFGVSLIILGILNAQGGMSLTTAVLSFILMAAGAWIIPRLGSPIQARYEALPRFERQRVQWLSMLGVLAVLVVAPFFLGQYITDVLNLVGLYIIMGIGLNIVVGFAGLLDLGYVAFFAIGAYSIGLLTTPSLLTCGGVPASQLTPETVGEVCRVLTFWEAWPLSIALGAVFGILLGIPVLRLRGDYLAIVTLGFGEIIRLIVKFDDFKPLFGAAQGIPNIPRPVIDLTAINPAWRVELTGATGIYYLILAGIVVTAIIGMRLASTRLGRAWRAMRADEDVAQAMGINLTQTKLLAFSIGAAFAAMGGAIAGTRLYGAYPDSYTLLVSINVLSLVIIGGLGSIPGVIIGSLVLIGLPEVLRELESYRLLAFGVLLAVAMLLKPEGLIPPMPRQLSEQAAEIRSRGSVTS